MCKHTYIYKYMFVCKLFKPKFIFIQINGYISNNFVKHKCSVKLSKSFLFQAIQFNQTDLIQTIYFSISIVFVYTQLISKQFCFKQFTLA